MPELPNLETELRDKIVARLALRDVDPASVTRDTPLFDGGLGLDSLDALELTVMLEEDYRIVVAVAERDAAIFGTLGTLADFVRTNYQRDIDRIQQ
ncbi:MAG: acyl carrier protein [Deltaproteobacteria bacterium]|nr:acyl carrier protein [Deltaproteobacteria bacterium]